MGGATDDVVFPFEDVGDSAVPLLPLAARRALDNAGLRLSLEGYQSLSREDQRDLAILGSKDTVDTGTVERLVRKSSLPPTRIKPVPDPDARNPPEQLNAALGARRAVEPLVWSKLRALDRYALIHIMRRSIAHDDPSRLEAAVKVLLPKSKREPLSVRRDESPPSRAAEGRDRGGAGGERVPASNNPRAAPESSLRTPLERQGERQGANSVGREGPRAPPMGLAATSLDEDDTGLPMALRASNKFGDEPRARDDRTPARAAGRGEGGGGGEASRRADVIPALGTREAAPPELSERSARLLLSALELDSEPESYSPPYGYGGRSGGGGGGRADNNVAPALFSESAPSRSAPNDGLRGQAPPASEGISTHLNQAGDAHMIDVGNKEISDRRATASGHVRMRAETAQKLARRDTPKGDVLAAARIAGIMAAKRTPELIPLCHVVALTSIEVTLEVDASAGVLKVTAIAKARDRTGVEMEALTAVSVACLTVYDMLKGIDKDMVIGDIRLDAKSGGRSNHGLR